MSVAEANKVWRYFWLIAHIIILIISGNLVSGYLSLHNHARLITPDFLQGAERLYLKVVTESAKDPHTVAGPSFFFHQTIPPGPLIHGRKPFWILIEFAEIWSISEHKNRACGVRNRMHENFLLGSPFKFIYFFRGGVVQFGNINVFDRYSL
jgi:hypothetical protein